MSIKGFAEPIRSPFPFIMKLIRDEIEDVKNDPSLYEERKAIKLETLIMLLPKIGGNDEER